MPRDARNASRPLSRNLRFVSAMQSPHQQR